MMVNFDASLGFDHFDLFLEVPAISAYTSFPKEGSLFTCFYMYAHIRDSHNSYASLGIGKSHTQVTLCRYMLFCFRFAFALFGTVSQRLIGDDHFTYIPYMTKI